MQVKPAFIANAPCPVCGKITRLGDTSTFPKKYCDDVCREIAFYARSIIVRCKKKGLDPIKIISSLLLVKA